MIVLVCKDSRANKNALYADCSNVEGIQRMLLDKLEKLSGAKLTPANTCKERAITNVYTGEIIKKSPASESIFEIDPVLWPKIRRSAEMRVIPSFYQPSDGKIILKGGCSWCLCNLIHEILHSRSPFSREPCPPLNTNFVVEGITELLTGWTLEHEFGACYANWHDLGQACFLGPYLKHVKLWLYLCRNKIGVSKIMNLYLDSNIRDPFVVLAELLRAEGLHGCGDSLSDRNNADASEFVDGLYEVFGSDFAQFYGANIKTLDLDKCLQ
jgi:hypothetical protein